MSTEPYTYNWSGVTRGQYTLRAAATDNAGIASYSQPIEVFVYGSGGNQSNAVSDSPASVNLTTEGTSDWTHWGLVTNTSFDYKASVPRQISNFSPLGTNAIKNYADNQVAFSWSDGAPTPATNGTTTGVFVTGPTNGFRLTAPADTNSRTLRVFVGGYGVQAEFEAYLSDLSARPYTDSSVSNVFGNSYLVYTIDYRASSPNQQLIVRYRSSNLFDLTYGNVTLQAATLQGGAPRPLLVRLINPTIVGGQFLFSFLTQSNFTYTVQTLDSLSSTNWTTAPSLSGTGSMLTVTNQMGGASQKYYRVQVQ